MIIKETFFHIIFCNDQSEEFYMCKVSKVGIRSINIASGTSTAHLVVNKNKYQLPEKQAHMAADHLKQINVHRNYGLSVIASLSVSLSVLLGVFLLNKDVVTHFGTSHTELTACSLEDFIEEDQINQNIKNMSVQSPLARTDILLGETEETKTVETEEKERGLGVFGFNLDQTASSTN